MGCIPAKTVTFTLKGAIIGPTLRFPEHGYFGNISPDRAWDAFRVKEIFFSAVAHTRQKIGRCQLETWGQDPDPGQLYAAEILDYFLGMYEEPGQKFLEYRAFSGFTVP
jgi:hypothetical protein